MGDSFADFTKGGMDTARVRGDEADVQRRLENARRARGNLAAMVVDRHGGVQACKRSRKKLDEAAEEFAGLLDMLGLDVGSPVRPGVCRGCGQELPMTAASWVSKSKNPHWKAGYCSARCWADSGG
jgi:predicted  nucleic acid-binding Zn-ribbon protein